MLDNLTISYIKEIQEASKQNRLVAFVGAGASCDAGVPLWNNLVSRMAMILPQDIQQKYDNLQLAQLVRETRDEKAYYASVRKNQQFWVVGKDSDLPQNHGERLLVKMQGDLHNENIVLTENDYYDYSRNFPLIRSYVVS